MKVYRIQNKRGRGPWMPGFSWKWVRRYPDPALIPWFEEWPEFDPRAETKSGEAIGTGCATIEQLRRWFTPHEYLRLRLLHFQAVEIKADRILRASQNQVVFACRRQLRKLGKAFDLYKL